MERHHKQGEAKEGKRIKEEKWEIGKKRGFKELRQARERERDMDEKSERREGEV